MPTVPSTYQFGPFRLDVAERRLLRDGVPIPLRLKVFDTLRVLVENAGRLVTKEELLQAVWPDTAVEENNLNHNVSVLRKALGERATGQQYIETVPRVGYRFAAPVEAIAGHKVAFEPAAIPAVVFTDPEIAWCGLTETQAQKENREIKVAKFPWAASGRAMTVDRTEGMTKLILDPQSERVLGVGIVGAGAGELIAEGVLAVEMAALAIDIALTIHPHPTLSETVMQAAEVFFGTSTDIYRPKKS